MSENIFPERIKFYQNHLPNMELGDYWITIKGSITHAKIPDSNTAGDILQRFTVQGERFTLTDKDVRATFPPAGSTGNYESILPHIIFHRNTFPWERHAVTGDENKPWLVLLLFDEDETPVKKVITVADLFSSSTGASGVGAFPTLMRETAQHDDEKLTVIDVPKAVLEKIAPSTADLILLAHARQGIKEGIAEGEENAIVFCNRLPERGKRSTVHLVSVEGSYKDTKFDFSNGNDLFRLVSLKSWEFYSIEHFKITSKTLSAIQVKASVEDYNAISSLLDREFAGTEDDFVEQVMHASGLSAIEERYKSELISFSKFTKTFDGILKNLNKENLTLRLPAKSSEDAEAFLSQGFVPLEHHFRNGDTSVSWYRGPFVPFDSGAHITENAVKDLTPQLADELTQYNEAFGMFDVSYSSAWEIGRLLAIENKDYSVNLFQWKRLIANHIHKARQSIEHEHLPVFAHSHNHESEVKIWERHIKPFLSQLVNFEIIPANYLLPDVNLLTKESIRFFTIDKNWQTALLSGAFSIGGNWSVESQLDDNAFTDFLSLEDTYVMGFLLRSDVLEGWPGLIIEGHLSDETKYTPLRRKLSRGAELFLFKARVTQVVFYQKPEVMHFGFTDINGVFRKKIRDKNGKEEPGDGQPISWKVSKNERTVDVFELAKSLGKIAVNPNENDKLAEFAMNMIEGVPRVLFNIDI